MKLKRYHIDIHVPDWGRESIIEFSNSLKGKKLKYSYHAKKKLKGLSKFVKTNVVNLIEGLDMSNDLLLDYVFEFYTDDSNKVKKVCYRFPMMEKMPDVILVVSYKGTIVTIYTNRDFDKHRTLKKDFYEQRKEIQIELQKENLENEG